MPSTDNRDSNDPLATGIAAEERARRAADRMRAVARAGAGLIGAHSVEGLQKVLEGACSRVLSFDVFSLAVYDPRAHTLSFLMGDDAGYPVPHLVVPVPGTPSEQVIRTRQTLVTHRSADPAGRGSVRVGSGRPSESAIRTPLLAELGVVGTITVQSYTPGLYGPEDVEVVETLGALAAPALLNIQRQHALREAERRHRAMTDALPVMIYMVEPVAPYSPIYVNPTTAALGYSHEEWMREPDLWTRILHPEDREWVLAKTEDALRAEGSTDYEYRVVTREGEVRWLHDHGHFIRDEHGRPTAWQGVMVDITERRAAEAALKEQRTELRQIIDVVPHMLFVKDEEGRYLVVNQAFAAAYGCHPDEVVGKRDTDLGIRPAEAERSRAEEQEVMHTGTPKFLPGESHSADGREYDVLRVLFHRAGTNQLGVLGLLRDVTDERQQAEQLQRAQRLAAVGTLVGGVAHELNNPLSAVMGLSQLMLMDPRSAEDRETLETIHHEAGRMARIVADLRDIARGSQEKGAARVPVNLNEVVRHVLRVRGYSLSTHNIRVVEDLDAGIGPVLADPGRLEQVVLNLVVNAEQAMASDAGHGTLVLRTRSGSKENSLTVGDTGPGIALEHQERIFDPFWTTKAPGEGTGLGLSVVHGIVDGLGGRIGVESCPNQGARFTVTLPRAGAPADTPSERSAAAPDASPPSRLRVLVVDDETSVRTTLARYLRRRGHEVDEAAEGGAALALLDDAAHHGQRYDAIVSDLRMPGLDGSQLLARLREQGGGMDRRLVFLTGDAASPHAERLLKDSGVPVVVKPFDFVRVEEIIGQLAHRRAHEEASQRERGEWDRAP